VQTWLINYADVDNKLGLGAGNTTSKKLIEIASSAPPGSVAKLVRNCDVPSFGASVLFPETVPTSESSQGSEFVCADVKAQHSCSRESRDVAHARSDPLRSRTAHRT
jgi:hypothetical protein